MKQIEKGNRDYKIGLADTKCRLKVRAGNLGSEIRIR